MKIEYYQYRWAYFAFSLAYVRLLHTLKIKYLKIHTSDLDKNKNNANNVSSNELERKTFPIMLFKHKTQIANYSPISFILSSKLFQK